MEKNFDPITYINRKMHFEEFTGYLRPKKKKKIKTISCGSDLSSDINVHVTLFIALNIAYYLNQKQNMVLI